VNDDKSLGNGYFGRVTAAPDDPDTVYVMGRSLKQSKDAGAKFEIIKGSPGGDDYHHLWINPEYADHWITAIRPGHRGHAERGQTWSSWYNQPDRPVLPPRHRQPLPVPHLLRPAGQRHGEHHESAATTARSRSATGTPWAPTSATWRSGRAEPGHRVRLGPGRPALALGSPHGEVQNITPWPISSYGERPTDFQYRYSWITPIAMSQRAPYPLYFGAQSLFRSTDQGAHWDECSGDLSGKHEGAKDCTGDLAPPAARDCGYGVVWSIELSPRDNDEIWVGTDDGNVQLTRDGGKNWRNVTPKGLPSWGMVSTIDVYEGAAGTAYVAVDNHRQDDFRPHVFVTHDFGATGSRRTVGFRLTTPSASVRSDPARAGLVYAGTEVGVFVSFDDGGHWQPLQRNLPVAWVRDLEVKGDDLIAATQGRAIWVLDGLNPLRELGPQWKAASEHLFTPGKATRVRKNQNKDTPLPPEEPVGENPPTGVIVDYWLAKGRRGRSHARDPRREGQGRAALVQQRRASEAEVRPLLQRGLGRAAAAGLGEGRRAPPGLGLPLPAPARTAVRILDRRGARASTARCCRRARWRRRANTRWCSCQRQGASRQGHRAHGSARRGAARRHGGFARVLARDRARARPLRADARRGAGRAQAARRAGRTREGREARAGGAGKQAAELDKQLDAILAGDGDTNTNLAGIGNAVLGVATDTEGTDRAPTKGQRDVVAASVARLERAEAIWQAFKAKDLAALDTSLKTAQFEPIHIPTAEEIDAGWARRARTCRDAACFARLLAFACCCRPQAPRPRPGSCRWAAPVRVCAAGVDDPHRRHRRVPEPRRLSQRGRRRWRVPLRAGLRRRWPGRQRRRQLRYLARDRHVSEGGRVRLLLRAPRRAG
jgi:hypothetical protein